MGSEVWGLGRDPIASRVDHVVELPRRPRRLEIGDRRERVDPPRRRVHDDDHLAGVEVVFARVLEEEVFGDPLQSEGCVEEVMWRWRWWRRRWQWWP